MSNGKGPGNMELDLGQEIQARLQAAFDGLLEEMGPRARKEGFSLEDMAFHAGSAFASSLANLGADLKEAGGMAARFGEGFEEKADLLENQDSAEREGKLAIDRRRTLRH